MTYVITQLHLDTRFYLTADGLPTDIEDRAVKFERQETAQAVARVANKDPQWLGMHHWSAVQLIDSTLPQCDLCGGETNELRALESFIVCVYCYVSNAPEVCNG